MPKRKFRKALIFITLLMIVTAFTIFQSPEYEKNYGKLESYENLAGDGDLAGMGTCTDALRGTSNSCPIILKQGTDVELENNKYYKTGTVVFQGDGIHSGIIKKATSTEIQFASSKSHAGISYGVVTSYDMSKGKLIFNEFSSQVDSKKYTDELNIELKKKYPELYKVLSDPTILESAKIKAAQAATGGNDITPAEVLGFKSEHKIPPSQYAGGTISYQEGTFIGSAPGEKKVFEFVEPTTTTYTNYITPTGKKIYQCDGKPCVEIGDKYFNIPTGVNIPAKHESTELYGFFTSGGISGTSQENSDAQVLYVVANDQQLDSIDTKYKTSGGSYTGNIIVQETNGAYSLLTVTPVSTPYPQKVVKVGSKYGVIGENGVIYPLAQQVFATTSGVVVVGENGQGKEYFSSTEKYQGQPVLSDGEQLFKYDSSTNNVVHVTGTVTYSDGSLAIVSGGNVEYTLTPTAQKTTDGKAVYTKTPAAVTLAGTGAGTPPSSEVYDESGVPINGKIKASSGNIGFYQEGKITKGLVPAISLGEPTDVFLQVDANGNIIKNPDGTLPLFNKDGNKLSTSSPFGKLSEQQFFKLQENLRNEWLSGVTMESGVQLAGYEGEGLPKTAVATDLAVSEEPLWVSEQSGQKEKQLLLVQEQVEQPEGITKSAQDTGYTTATGKPVFVYNNQYYIKVGGHYELIPQGINVPVKQVVGPQSVYIMLGQNGKIDVNADASDEYKIAFSKEVDISGASITSPEGEQITFGGAVLAQVAQGQYGFVGVTPTDYQADGKQIFKVGDSYTTLDDNGNFYPITQGTLQYGSDVLVIKKGQGAEYSLTGGTSKDKPVLKAADGTFFTFDADKQKLAKFTTGTITYSDGIGIIKKGEETRLYERTTEDGQTIYTPSSAATGFSKTESAYDQNGKPLKNTVVKLGSVYYAYDATGFSYVVTNVGATDENGNNVFWSSQFNKFMTKDGKNAKGTVTYKDEKGNSQTVSLDNGLLPSTYSPPPTLQPSESVQVPEGVAAVSQTISNLNSLKGKIDSSSTDTIKADNAVVVEALKQAGATVTSGNEKQAVEEFQKAWIQKNCGSDGKSCAGTCIGKSVSGVCTADGKVGSKTIGALSATLLITKEGLYAAPQPEEKKIVAGIAQSGNVYSFTNTKGETVSIPTDLYQGILQKMDKDAKYTDPKDKEYKSYGGKLTTQQIALLYETMSKEHPGQMNLDDLKCSANSCYVDNKGIWTGDIVYTVEELKDSQGNPYEVVQVYEGVDGKDFDKEKGEGYDALTYYHFIGNHLVQVNSVSDGVTSIYNTQTRDRVLTSGDKTLEYRYTDQQWHGTVKTQDGELPFTIDSKGEIFFEQSSCNIDGSCQQLKEQIGDQYSPLIEHIEAQPTLNNLVASAEQFGAQPISESLPPPSQGEARMMKQEVTAPDGTKATITYGGTEKPKVIGNTAGLVFVKKDGENTIWGVTDIFDQELLLSASTIKDGTVTVNGNNEVIKINKKDGNSVCDSKTTCDQYMKGKFSLTTVLAAIAELKKVGALTQQAGLAQPSQPAQPAQPEQGDATVTTQKVTASDGSTATITYGGGQPPNVAGTTVEMTFKEKMSNGETIWELNTLPGKTVKNENLKAALGGFVTLDKNGKIVSVENSEGNKLCSGDVQCQQKLGTSLDNLLEEIKKIPPPELTQKSAEVPVVEPAPVPADERTEPPPPPAPPKPYTPPKNVAGLDAEGYVAACINGVESCEQKDAQFAFKHESILDGVEGYVYVETDEDGEIKKDDKTKQPITCNAGAISTGSCKAVNCKDLTGCNPKSDGDRYCTQYQGAESCVNDPTTVTEKIIEECAKPKPNPDAEKCAGANALSSQLYDSLDFEFRSRVEVVFGSLFDDWSNNAFSRLEYWMYDSICHMNYYNAGASEVDLIAGGTITQEHNFAHNLSYLGPNEIIVTLGGEKEEINGTIYRYAFSIQTIGPVHGIVYLYNKCTQKKSFSTTGTGWKDEFVVNNPLGVHRNHYATDQLTFDCDMEGIEECRFDHACLKILDNDGYVAPLCQKLEGDEIILNTETMDTDCGNVASTALVALGLKKGDKLQ